jgi:hypothetical protein
MSLKMRPLYWVILITLVLFTGLMMISPSEKKLNPDHLPWNAKYNTNGQLEALGLTLNQSTLKDAMDLYGRDIEIKLFEMTDGTRTAEGYFNSMYIGSIHSALVIKLAIQADDLTE